MLLPPRRAFCNEKGEPLRFNAGTAGKSGRRKLCTTDWDGDGRVDLLLNSSNADFLKQVAAPKGKGHGQGADADGKPVWYFEHVGALAEKNIEGHDVSPAVVDFDGNGIPDFLGGAEDGRFYYLKNPRTK